MKKNQKKNKNYNKIYFIAAIVLMALIIILALILSDKRLDLKSEQVSTLYNYLGEVDVYRCGGLITYKDKAITKDEISNENALCMAYYNLKNDKITTETAKSTRKNKNNIKTCKVGESITLAAKDEENECQYSIINKKDLNDSYKKIYGENIKDYSKFFISSTEACYIEGDTYYCGTAESYIYSLTPAATIYRLLNKAVKKINGDIVIYDYFLKESDNKCYPKNNNEENKECSKEIKSIENIDEKFVSKYGNIYKHTFKKDDSGNYYWFKSELK